MKLLLSGSFIAFLIALFFLQSSMTSCTKENTIYDTVTVIRKDTVTVKDTLIIRDTALTAEILTANQWKLQELRGVSAADTVVYFRGGASNTYNYDDDYIVFYTDGTGYYLDADGYGHSITNWQFANDEHTKLTFNMFITNSPVNYLVTWENIRYKSKALRYDEYFHDTYININVHDQAVRIPK